MFQLNHKVPPRTDMKNDIMKAGILTTGMVGGLFSMGLYGYCWTKNISTIRDFRGNLNG